jgi:glutaredoxin-like protein NrdH
MSIVLWTKPNCSQCETTKRQFDKRGIIYKIRKLTPKAVERFIELGLTSAPIIETDDRRWSGFRLEKIKSLEMHLKSERAHGVNVPLQPIKQVAEEVGEDE